MLRLVFPPKCVICGDLLSDSIELCQECLEIWKSARLSRCPICNKTARGCTCRTFHMTDSDTVGDRCMSALAFYGKFGSADKKDILVRRLVYAVKTSSDRSAVKFCARELSHEILKTLMIAGENTAEWKITYPQRSRKRTRKYGFDHGRDLARLISKYTGLSLEATVKNKGKTAQKSLNALKRKINADNSYSLIDGYTPSGKYILCDDVITTGATVNSCARLLKESGASEVFPVCIARTKKKKRKLRRPAERPWFRSK